MNWTNTATNATSVVLERAVGAGAFSVLATLAPTDTSYLDTTVVPGPYSYQVEAVNPIGPSAYAGPVTVDVPKPGSTTVVLNTPNPSLGRPGRDLHRHRQPGAGNRHADRDVTFTVNGATTAVAVDAAGVGDVHHELLCPPARTPSPPTTAVTRCSSRAPARRRRR